MGRPSRVWRKYGLKPHQIRRFKLSRDPRLVEKLQTARSLETQPGLPLKKGRA